MTTYNMPKQNNPQQIGMMFRKKREEKGLLVRQVAAVTELDQAVISRIENGERLPTEEQVIRLAGLYGLDPNRTLTDWLSEKIVREYGDSPYASKAIRIAQERIMYNIRQSKDKDIS